MCEFVWFLEISDNFTSIAWKLIQKTNVWYGNPKKKWGNFWCPVFFQKSYTKRWSFGPIFKLRKKCSWGYPHMYILDAPFFFRNPIPNVGLLDQFSSYVKNSRLEGVLITQKWSILMYILLLLWQHYKLHYYMHLYTNFNNMLHHNMQNFKGINWPLFLINCHFTL